VKNAHHGLSPLDFWQATLLATGVGLAVLYTLAEYLAELPIGSEFQEDQGDKDWKKS
jgi:hypothetical protein